MSYDPYSSSGTGDTAVMPASGENDPYASLDAIFKEYPDLSPDTAAGTALRTLKAKALPAAGTAIGGAVGGAVGELAGPEAIPVGAVAGGAAGGAAGQGLYDWAMGDPAAKRERAQLQLDALYHPYAEAGGAATPTLAALAGGGGLMKAIGSRAAKNAMAEATAKGITGEELEAIGQKAATDAIETAGKNKALTTAEASLAGAKLGGSETAERAVQGDKVGLADFADSMAHNAVAFGPFGLLPHIDGLFKSMGMAVPQAYLSTVSSAAYDSMVHGKPFDLEDIAGKGTAEVVPFAIFNAISHGVQSGQKLFGETQRKAEGDDVLRKATADVVADQNLPPEAAKAVIDSATLSSDTGLKDQIADAAKPLNERTAILAQGLREGKLHPLDVHPDIRGTHKAAGVDVDDPNALADAIEGDLAKPTVQPPPAGEAAPEAQETPAAPPAEQPIAPPMTPDEADPGTVLEEPQRPGAEAAVNVPRSEAEQVPSAQASETEQVPTNNQERSTEIGTPAEEQPAARAHTQSEAKAPAVESPIPKETQSDLADVPVHRVPASEIATRPDLMQFKRMDDTSSGVNESDRLSGKWDDLKAGNLLLWEPVDGKKYGLAPGQKYIVANGHHRAEFGARNGVQGFHAQIVREADGYSVQDARRLAAEINIADGKGTIHDQVKFIRNIAATHGTNEALAAAGRIGSRGEKAANIALSASDSLHDLFVNNLLSADATEAIALAAPGDDGLQRVGAQEIMQGATAEAAVNLMKAVKARMDSSGGYNERQLDLLSKDDAAMVEMREQAKRATAEQRNIREQIAAAKGAAKNPKAAAKLGVDVKDPEAVKAKLAELSAELERWKNWGMHPDLVARASGKPLELEAQTPDQVTAEREKAKRREAMERQQAAPLKGGLKAGDEVPDLFGPTEGETPLLSQPAKAPASLESALKAADEASATPEGREARMKGDAALVDKLNQGSESRPGVLSTRMKVADESKVAPAFARFRNLFETLFHHRIILVEPEKAGERGFHGARFEGNNILINLDSATDSMAVLGHEFMHSLKADHPELYSDLIGAIDRLGIFSEDQIQKYGEENLKGLYDQGDYKEEAIHNLIGDRFFAGDVFEKLAREEPGLFTRLATMLRQWIADVRSRLSGSGGYDMANRLGLDEVSLSKLDQYLVKTMREVASGKPSEGDPTQFSATNEPETPKQLVDLTTDGFAEARRRQSTQEERELDSPQAVALFNASIDAERQRLGMEPAPTRPRVRVVDIHSDAYQELLSDPTKPERILDAVENENHTTTPEEDSLLRQYAVHLENQIDKATGTPRALPIYDKLDRLLRVSKLTGSRQGLGLRLRQTALNRLYSFEGMGKRVMAGTGEPPTPEQWEVIGRYAKEFAALTEEGRQQAQEHLKKLSEEHLAKTAEEAGAANQESAHWLDEAMESLNASDREHVDTALDRIYLIHKIAERKAQLGGPKFSAEGKISANEARQQRLSGQLAEIAKADKDGLDRLEAKYRAELLNSAKAIGQADAAGKALTGDETARKMLESMAKATTRKTKPVDAVRQRFAEEVRKPGDPAKFTADLKKLGVEDTMAGRLHAEALKKAAKRTAERAAKVKARAAIESEGSDEENDIVPLDEIKESLVAGDKTLSAVPPKVMRDAMRSLVASGLRGDAEVMPALTKLLNGAGIEGSEEQVREHAISYGKVQMPSQEELEKALREVRAEGLKVASIRRVEQGEAPLKTGPQRDKPHQKARELTKELKDKMKAAGISLRSSEQQLASIEDATITRLKNDIEDLQAQVDAGARKIRAQAEPAHSEKFKEAQANLLARKKTLSDILDKISPKPEETPEQREKRLVRAAERVAEYWQERVKKGTWEEKQGGGPVGKAVEEARARAAEAKEAFEQARDAARPDLKKDPNALALARYNRSLDKREAELDRRLREKDYSKVARNKTVLDGATQTRKIAFERKQRQFNAQVDEWTAKNRAKLEKTLDFFPKLKRFSILSSPVIFAKLAATSLTKGFTGTMEEILGGALSKAIPALGKRASLEGGMLSRSGLVKALTRAHVKVIDDAHKTLTLGESDLDVALSKKGMHERDIWGIPGRLHAMMKSPLKRVRYETAFEKLSEAYIRDGGDPQDLSPTGGNELVIAKISAAAYKAAQRGIFSQDNIVADVFTSGIKRLENAKGTGGPALARIAKTLLPVVRIPTNIVMESAQYVGGVPIGLVRLAKAWHTGMDKLTPDQADSIMRTLKKGSLGAGLMLLGFYSNAAGGYYNADEKRKPGDPKIGGFKLFGVDIPQWLTHAPAFEAIQFGATIRRALNNQPKASALPSAAMAAALGLAEETPFLDEMMRVKDMQTEDGRRKFFGELARSEVEPALLQKVAQWTDRSRPLETFDLLTGEGTQRRAERTFGETMKAGVPGLRKELPYKVDSAFNPTKDEVPEAIHQYATRGYPMPGKPERGILEKKNGELSNEKWDQYAVIRGNAVERQMLRFMPYLMRAGVEDKKKKVLEIDRDATKEAKGRLNLK